MSWIYLFLYQAAWWTCALSGPFELPLIGPLTVCIQLLVWLFSVQHPLRECVLILSLSLMGIVVDSILVDSKILIIPAYFLAQPPFPPLWLASLWISFVVGIRSCLQKIRTRYLLASFLGLVGGPLAYSGGQSLNALFLSEQAPWMLALIWAAIFPLFLRVSDHYTVQLRFQQPS